MGPDNDLVVGSYLLSRHSSGSACPRELRSQSHRKKTIKMGGMGTHPLPLYSIYRFLLVSHIGHGRVYPGDKIDQQ